jgi:hypothetical protein
MLISDDFPSGKTVCLFFLFIDERASVEETSPTPIIPHPSCCLLKDCLREKQPTTCEKQETILIFRLLE